MCLTILGFGKGTVSGCARIIHAICIGPKIVAGSLFSVLQSLGNNVTVTYLKYIFIQIMN